MFVTLVPLYDCVPQSFTDFQALWLVTVVPRLLVDQIRIEDVKLVALDDFRRRIIHIIVSLIVFIPIKSSVDTNRVDPSLCPRPPRYRPLVEHLR